MSASLFPRAVFNDMFPQMLSVVDCRRRICVKIRLDKQFARAELSTSLFHQEARCCLGLLHPMQYVGVKHKSELNTCYPRRRLFSHRTVYEFAPNFALPRAVNRLYLVKARSGSRCLCVCTSVSSVVDEQGRLRSTIGGQAGCHTWLCLLGS